MRKTPTARETQDTLVPDPLVQQEFGVTAMTIHRWDHDPNLNFPPKIKIRTKNYRSRKALEQFKADLIVSAMRDRAGRT
jgi:hypothetical protein